MNAQFAGKSIPDMNGIVVHANIISMALEKNYVKKVPLWGNLLLAILVCWLHMSFFIHYYLESHIWFHLVAKIAQVFSAIFFVWLGIYLFDRYRLKVDMKLSLIVIVLAVDVIYFYEAWAVWMHKKFNFKQCLNHIIINNFYYKNLKPKTMKKLYFLILLCLVSGIADCPETVSCCTVLKAMYL